MRIDEITQTPDEIAIDYIKLHCQKYLDEVGGIENALQDIPLWRGISTPNFAFDRGEWARIVPVRQDRRPLTNTQAVQTAVDDWFQEKFGIRFRQSSVFCTGEYDDARSYQSSGSTTVIVLPVGDYDYCWASDIGDLFIELQRATRQGPLSQQLTTVLEQGHYKCNEDIIDGIRSGNEIMLHCQSVMLVNLAWPKLFKGLR